MPEYQGRLVQIKDAATVRVEIDGIEGTTTLRVRGALPRPDSHGPVNANLRKAMRDEIGEKLSERVLVIQAVVPLEDAAGAEVESEIFFTDTSGETRNLGEWLAERGHVTRIVAP